MSDRSICSVFNILELGFHSRENAGLIQPINLRRSVALPQLASDPIKSAMSLFLAEVLYKTLHDDYHNKNLFDFLRDSIIQLETTTQPLNIHLWILAQIISFYGFAPENAAADEPYFDLNTGGFSKEIPAHQLYLEPPLSTLFMSLFSARLGDLALLPMDNSLRSLMLERLVEYLQIHHEGVREIKSHHVLREVFRG
jgi:DNA repair protein RecO (recombination protein O)